jgi:acyl-CoA hydrolase
MENYRLVLPEHLNQFGFLFGGYLLKWVDEVAWMAASIDYPDCHFVTVGMDEVAFHRSVKGGSILRFQIDPIRKGNTSLTYGVKVLNNAEEVFSTAVTFVRVNEGGEKQSLPNR